MFDSGLIWMQFYICRRLNKGLMSFIFHNLLLFFTIVLVSSSRTSTSTTSSSEA